jgi:hypothetical protein
VEDNTYSCGGKERAFLLKMLEGWPDLAVHFEIDGQVVHIRHEQSMGHSSGFILDCFKSLRGWETMSLANICMLDSYHFPLFLEALSAWKDC